MSTPSSADGGSAPEPGRQPRPLQDRWLFRLLALLAVLAAAALASRSCASSGEITKDGAVAIAVEQVDFDPECYQVRFYRSGIKSTPIWAVSLWTLERGRFGRIAVVRVDAHTGTVAGVDLNARSPYTQPQCASPI